ncbi:MAG: hypothetical protein M4579_007511, partial [Chaenotheca gracillima]
MLDSLATHPQRIVPRIRFGSRKFRSGQGETGHSVTAGVDDASTPEVAVESTSPAPGTETVKAQAMDSKTTTGEKAAKAEPASTPADKKKKSSKKAGKGSAKPKDSTTGPAKQTKTKTADDTSQTKIRRTNTKSKLPARRIKSINKKLAEASELARDPDISRLDSAELQLEALDDLTTREVPGLSYGLERVLFNPGVYQLQDARTRVFNFDPYLSNIMPVSEFDFGALKRFITSSQDESLKSMAHAHGKKYIGSSSSMTGALGQFHFLLSQWRPITTDMLSRGFPDPLKSFTTLQRIPTAIFLRKRDGVYAIDADKEYDTGNILSMLGKSMEKLLTLSKEDYERYRRSNSEQVDEDREAPESYHYSTIGDVVMRSQLDAHDPRLPGTGMFDLKTRAVVSIRMDTDNYRSGMGYQIRERFGNFESFEREYFDMIRS